MNLNKLAVELSIVVCGGLFIFSTSLYASSKEQNATFIHLPKVPKVNSIPVMILAPKTEKVNLPKVPQVSKAMKVAPLITITPKQDRVKTKTISEKEYLEYQKLKAKVAK